MNKSWLNSVLALGILFGLAVIKYSFFQPFKTDAVLQAIPAQASFVFKADDLDALLQSPVCGQLDKALGAGQSLREIAAASGWTSLVAASELAVADIPFRDAGIQKSWAAVSWVGWRSPWLRWKLEHARSKNLKLLGKHAVWPIWMYTDPQLARGMTLTFALTDNLFIACLSENPTDILLLLDTYDKRTPVTSAGKG